MITTVSAVVITICQKQEEIKSIQKKRRPVVTAPVNNAKVYIKYNLNLL
jgi:hypothetical protein